MCCFLHFLWFLDKAIVNHYFANSTFFLMCSFSALFASLSALLFFSRGTCLYSIFSKFFSNIEMSREITFSSWFLSLYLEFLWLTNNSLSENIVISLSSLLHISNARLKDSYSAWLFVRIPKYSQCSISVTSLCFTMMPIADRPGLPLLAPSIFTSSNSITL